MPYHLNPPLFPSGEFLLSSTVHERGFDFLPLLNRHLAGDWGEISDYDRACNAKALVEGSDVLSQYTAADAKHVEDLITIVTAADRTYTVVFLPGDSGK